MFVKKQCTTQLEDLENAFIQQNCQSLSFADKQNRAFNHQPTYRILGQPMDKYFFLKNR